MNFKRRLVVYSILISTIPVLLVGWFATVISSNSIQEEVQLNHQLLLKQIEYRIDQLLNNLNTQAVMIATNALVEKAVESGPAQGSSVDEAMAFQETLKKQSNYSTIRYDISLIYRKYDHVYSTVRRSIPFKNSQYETILNKMATKRNAPLIVPPSMHGNPGLILMRPVPYHSYYTEGIIALNVAADEMNKLLEDSGTEPNYHSDVLVVDADGKIIVSSSEHSVGSQLMTSSELYKFWKSPQEESGEFVQNGAKMKLTALKLTGYDWTILAMTPVSELNGKVQRIQQITWAMILLLTLFWLVISFTGTRQLHAPIERLLKRVPPEYSQNRQTGDGLSLLEALLTDTLHDNKTLRQQFHSHLPSLQENMSHHLLWGDMSEAEILHKADQLGISFKGSQFRVLLAVVDNFSNFAAKYQGKDQSLIHYALRKMMEEIGEARYSSCTAFTPQPGQVAVIVGEAKAMPAAESQQALLETAMEIRQAVNAYCKFTVSVCISGSQAGLAGIRQCYSEALELSSFRMLLGPNTTITDNLLEPAMKQNSKEIVSLHKKMLSSLIAGDLDHTNDYLLRLTEQIERTVIYPEAALGMYAHFLVELDACLLELGHELADMFPDNLHTKLYRFDTVAEIRNWLSEDVFPVIAASLKESAVSEQEKAVRAVLQSVEENWDADLMHIAGLHRISVPNLSRAFKEKLGENFSDYLIRSRMTKAKEWLAHTRMPIAEIAERLNYSNVQNFNRIFKQHTGMTPGAYRNRTEEQ
ncbi:MULTISPECIES: helix-turn-helix domain-containing protein [unclassified Paenibacillus]|uniref:helix-turn-helix domain-containing protein n=1 Tax=unclassified Paenibacillus TaxID=185978 RepID=UPI0015A0A910|nr:MULTISPECIES: helix-turn-helix domain-containing protein [unclassified Paenibacillus]